MKLAKENLDNINKLLDEVKVIYTDMDGTLVHPSGNLFESYDGSLSMKAAEAVMGVLKADKDVVIISGRTRIQLKENARMLGFKNYIAELGCEIVYDLGKKIVYNLGELELEKNQKPIKKLEEMGVLELLFRKIPNRIRYYTPWSENVETHPLLVGRIDVAEVNKLLAKEGFGFLKVTDNGEVPPEPDFARPHCYHLLPHTAGKRSAVRKDKEIRGLKKENLVGIGESLEDMAISPEVGAYFVVRNGAESDPEVAKAIEERENTFLLESRMGEGWAEAIAILTDLGNCCV